MTDAWAKFWIAIGLMAIAGALALNSVFGNRLEIGAIAQWASAIATIVAIWVALKNTSLTLEKAEAREIEKQRNLDQVYSDAIIAMCDQVIEAIEIMEEHGGGEVRTIEYLRYLSKLSHADGLVSSLDRIPLHIAPNAAAIEALTCLRIAARNAQVELNLAIEQGEPVAMSFEDELVLANRAKTIFLQSLA